MAGKRRSEGETYPCTWAKAGKGFRLAVKGRPELVGEGRTFLDARSALAESILLATGDGEPFFQFDKALPKGVLPEGLSDPEILWIGGNDTAVLEKPANLYEGGICTVCGNPAGKRNAKPARLAHLPAAKSDGADASHLGPMFSQAFLDLLVEAGGPSPEFRPVKAEGRKGKPLFEPAGRPVADLVAAAGFPVEGVQCAKCNARIFHQMISGELRLFLAKDDLPDPLPAWFLARSRENLLLCMPGSAWRSIEGKPGTTKVVAIPMGVVPADKAVREPKLQKFKG
jgi:hypothetical protein